MRKGQPLSLCPTPEIRSCQAESAYPASRPAPSPAYLTTSEVALDLAVHPATVVRFIIQGRLAAAKFGRGARAHWRISRSDLEAFKRASEVNVRPDISLRRIR